MNINIYNPYVRQELELYHHGVAGQRWGKRNGPPYPIAASAHSASEKKAGWRKSLNGGSSDKKSSKKIDPNTIDDIEIVDIMLGDPDYKSQRKELKKRFDYLAKKEVEENQRKPLSSTGALLAEEKLEDELRELSKIADKPNDKVTSYDIDRRVAFQGLINDLSIDPNNLTRPKSDNAIKWKQDLDNAYQKVSDTLGQKASDVDHDTYLKREKILNDFRTKHKNSIENPIEWNKVTKKIEKLYNSPEYQKAWKDFDDARDAVRFAYKDKLIEVVLKDLDIPINSANKAFIVNSQLIDFSSFDSY